ncbi:uncharacterized protein LOC117119363 [Anneissia japonica]|uniref:uncharacterized protein LOC117119363 n=1 Tax=Anneissia japonica TaxID=1529436 RepID=UPI001425B2C4|nr:uncharacterized protein LOC117119363 [Anneissia japonica]
MSESDRSFLVGNPIQGSTRSSCEAQTESTDVVSDGTDGLGSVASLLNAIANAGASVLRISNTARRYPEQFNSLEQRTKRVLMVLIELKVEFENNELAKKVLEDIRSNLISAEDFLLSHFGDRRTCMGLCLSLLRYRWVNYKLEHIHQNLDSCLLNILIIQSNANKNLLLRSIKETQHQKFTRECSHKSTQADRPRTHNNSMSAKNLPKS